MMIRRFFAVAIVLLLTVNLVVGCYIYIRDAEDSNTRAALKNVDIILQVVQLLRNEYVDGDKLVDEKLLVAAMQGMTSSLDPWTRYVPWYERAEMDQQSKGYSYGIGISYQITDGGMLVEEVYRDSPAEKAGLHVNDLIISWNGLHLADLRRDVIMHKMAKDKSGIFTERDVLELVVRRGGENGEPLEFAINKESYIIPSVTDVHIIADTEIGFIRISQFNEPTAEDFEKELRRLADKRIKGLIIDLRDNPGGLVHVTVRICSHFLKNGALVSTQEGKLPKYDETMLAMPGYKFPKEIPIVVLVNGNSASASELMSSCLKDHERATIVGTRTFGKGVGQSQHVFEDGSALYMTIFRYYTLSRTNIHGEGLEPDVVSELSVQELRRLRSVRDMAERDAQDKNIQDAIKILQSRQEVKK